MIWTIKKSFEISASHQLHLPYESKCNNLHGHNWLVDIYVSCSELENGMVVDFNYLKEQVFKKLDHHHLNDLISMPTVENIALWIAEEVGLEDGKRRFWCTKVVIQESQGNVCELVC